MRNPGYIRPLGWGFCLVLCALLAACGGSNSTGTNEQPSTPDASEESDAEWPDEGLMDFALLTAGAMCEKSFECCSAAELEELYGEKTSTVEECTDHAGFRSFLFGYGMLDESVKAGRIKVDPTLIDMCLESIARASCEEFSTSPDLIFQATGCHEVLLPQVEKGDACEADQDCLSDYCAESTGTCQELPQNGDDCGGFMRCEEGHFCDTFDFICETQRPDGDSCMDDEECESGHCIEDAAEGLVCGTPAPTCSGA